MKLRYFFRLLLTSPVWLTRWLIGLVAASMMLCLLSGDAAAGDDGWTYARGQWFYCGAPYDEKWYQEPYQYTACDAYGCVRTYTAYRWKAYYVPVKVVPGPNAINQLLSIAAARDQGEIYNRRLAAEAAQIDVVARTLGLNGNFRYDAYGLNPYLPQYLDSFSSTERVQTGSTIYTSRYRTVEQKDTYGIPVDLNSIELRRQQSVDNSMVLTKEMNAGTAETARIYADGKVRADEERERRQTALALLRETAPQPRTTVRTEKTELVPTISMPAPPLPQPTPPKLGEAAPLPKEQPLLSAEEFAAFQALAEVKSCVSCHGAGKENQAAFDITTYHPRTASREVRRAVFMYGEGASKCTGPKLKPEGRVKLVLP